MLKICEPPILEPIWGFATENYLMFMKNSIKDTENNRQRWSKNNLCILIPSWLLQAFVLTQQPEKQI